MGKIKNPNFTQQTENFKNLSEEISHILLRLQALMKKAFSIQNYNRKNK